MRRGAFVALLITALAIGLTLAWVDSRPHWDDTGIIVGVLLLTCAALGAVRPAHAWLWAVAVGLWIPLFEVPRGNSGALAALVFALIGAYAGALGRRLLARPPGSARS